MADPVVDVAAEDFRADLRVPRIGSVELTATIESPLRFMRSIPKSEHPSVPERLRHFRVLRWILLAVVIVPLLGMVGLYVRELIRRQTFYAAHGAVWDRIRALADSPPQNVDGSQWRQAVDWTANLTCQVYFSPSQERLLSLRRLEKALDEKAQGKVDLQTLRWIWDEIQADNPNSRYPVDFWNDELFGEPPATDNSLLQLRTIHRRYGLDLTGCGITDAGLRKLEGLTNLRVLILRSTEVTDEGVKRLQQALPECRIER